MRNAVRLALMLAVLVCSDAYPIAAKQDYIALVERYARCDDRAAYDLLEQPMSTWSRQGVPPGLAGAAIVLHAHAALLTKDAGEARSHLERARALFGPHRLNRLPSQRTAAPPRLYLPLYVLTAGFLQAGGEVLPLRDHLDNMPPDLPRATWLVLRGAADEFYNSDLVSWRLRARALGAADSTLIVPGSRVYSDRAWLQERAIGAFREAVTLAPDNGEARVRLGRLLLVSDKLDEAEAQLRQAAQPQVPTVVRYWAGLFLGRLYQKQADFASAERAYREAVTLAPEAQTGRVALAQLLWQTGRSEEAGDVLDPMVAPRTDRNARDPWWDYILSSYWQREQLLADMRQIVRECR